MPDTTPATATVLTASHDTSSIEQSCVVLVACEDAPVPDPAVELSKRLAAMSAMRILLRYDGEPSVAAGRLLAEARIPIQVLGKHGQLAYPAPAERVAVMPPGTTETELDQLGLALSDALLLIGEAARHKELERKAGEYGKPVVVLRDDGTLHLRRANEPRAVECGLTEAVAGLVTPDASVEPRRPWPWLERLVGVVDHLSLWWTRSC